MIKKIRKSIFKYKTYSHFDNKKEVKNWYKYIKNPANICCHGFYPFIHFTMKKYTYKNDNTKIKPREICYSSHIDRYIYEYYNYLLNEKYNSYAKDNNINKCAVAYRNNLHQNNITVAKEVFNFIKNGDNYYILISDFSKYFDTINHKHLKDTLKRVLGVDVLSEDWYKVFKSVTKYSYIDLDNIAKYNNKTLRDIRKSNRIVDAKELHKLKKYLNTNKNDYGIPQGSSISATLSNVNLIDYDKELNNFITSKNGLYRRYCDDLIIIIPIEHEKELMAIYKKLNTTTPGLTVNDEKNQVFYFKNKTIYKNLLKSKIKYLGFEFDGSRSIVRERTITSFYLKAYRSIKGINIISEKFKRNAYRKQFYKSFTHLGKKKTSKNRGNFLSYIDRCASVFEEPAIKKQVKNHWNRFSKRLINQKVKISKESPNAH